MKAESLKPPEDEAREVHRDNEGGMCGCVAAIVAGQAVLGSA